MRSAFRYYAERVFLFLALATFGGAASAETVALSGAVSPNGRYVLVARRGSARAEITYQILNRHAGTFLLKLKSSYQEAKEESANWSWDQTSAAEVHWRSDSRVVVLDEANHNAIGTVLVASERSNRFRELKLHLPMQLLGVRWQKSRLFFERFFGEKYVQISLQGTAGSSPGPYEEKAFLLTLRLPDGAVIGYRRMN
ncbi:MAG TPA: hypothetical protein VGM54_24390 [Chthoniobacter sp.]|jgi:hypothetical protein